jgi:RHS repeat-associated protein
MAGRGFSSAAYRFGFNGKEKEVDGTADNYDFGARIYDGRLGRWLSVDPLFNLSIYESPFCFVSNNSILYIDKEGGTKYLVQNVINEQTGETLQLKIVINSDLKRTVRMKTETTRFLGWTVSSEVKDKVEWRDINIVQNVVIDKDGKITYGQLSEEQGDLRYTNGPIKDFLGINNTQEEVNQTLDEKKDPGQQDWGGINFTWGAGQGQESRKGSRNISIENIDLLMDILTGPQINEFNIPTALLNESDALTVLNVFHTSITKAVDMASSTETLAKQVDAFKKEVEKWKSENTVHKCTLGYLHDPSTHEVVCGENDAIPNGKVVANDPPVDCTDSTYRKP